MKKALSKIIRQLMITIALLGVVVVSASIQLANAPVFPPSGGLMFVEPETNHFSTSDMTVGSTFDINVTLFNTTGIAGIQFKLKWDPTLLNCTNIAEVAFHTWTPAAFWSNIWSLQLRRNNTGGYAEYAQAWQNNGAAMADGYAPANVTTATNPPDGAQTIATLTMMVLKLPTMAEGSLSCPLNITLAIVGDLYGDPIMNSGRGIGNPPQSGTYTITFSSERRFNLVVHVVDAYTNASISGADVVEAGPENRSGVTDGGTVVFNQTLEGVYVVSASKVGYDSASVNVNLTEDTEIRIRLVPLAPPTPVPRELKRDAVQELETAKNLTTKKLTKDKIDHVIEEIRESLNAILWVDDFHLDPKQGSKVFQEEKDAVGHLMQILNDTKEDTVVKNITRAVIGKLLRVDEILAATAIKDAKDLGSTDPRVIREIKEADEEFSQALKDIANANYDNAVEEFKHAWMRAQHAMKKAFGDANVDGKVDILDVLIVCRAFGSCDGTPNWNHTADLNGDNNVNLADCILVGVNMGNVYD